VKIYAALGSGFVSEHQTRMEALAQQYCKNRLFSYAYHGMMSDNIPGVLLDAINAMPTNIN
jgi:hypothetical protein